MAKLSERAKLFKMTPLGHKFCQDIARHVLLVSISTYSLHS